MMLLVIKHLKSEELSMDNTYWSNFLKKRKHNMYDHINMGGKLHIGWLVFLPIKYVNSAQHYKG